DGTAWHSGTSELTPVGSAVLAASYFLELYQSCRATACTAVAGDFADGSGSMGSYPTDYKRQLTSYGITPSAWAAHAYSAVNNAATGWLSTFFTSVAPASATWITEVGVKVCDAGLS